MAEEYNMPYIEVSSKTRYNADEAVQAMIEEIKKNCVKKDFEVPQ